MTDFGAQRLDDFLDALASKQPTPGGGAVAGVVGAIAAALGQMVLAYSIGRKSLAEHDELHQRAAARLAELRARALELAAQDAEAYAALNALWRLPEDDPVRQRDFQDAVRAAIAAPNAAIDCALDMLRCLNKLHGATNRMLDSDFAIAANLAFSAACAAEWNVRVNLPSLDDDAECVRIKESLNHRILAAAEIASAYQR